MGVARKLLEAVAIAAWAGFCQARSPDTPRPLTGAEEQTVATCLTLIRGCQLPDGAFAQAAPGDKPAAAVWIAPYFASYAALALLADHARTKNPDELARVRRWLVWCAKNQSVNGYWNDFEGTAAVYANNGTVDAWDSSAALFLLVAGRYHRAGGQATPDITAAARRALACLATVTDRDGLTWAKPDYKIKYLMDNIEVRAGLRSGAEFFAAAGSPVEAKQAGDQAERIGRRLRDFWLPADALFAHALNRQGTFEGGLHKPYPHGLAQLFGMAFVAPDRTAWMNVTRAFSPETGPAAAPGAEWWLIAASRLGGRETQAWRAKMVQEVASFNPQSVYVYRPALAVLALLEGADWMPE